MTTFRAGFVAVVGRPNVGKSTLINKIVGEKVSIVTSKPQTTRHRILAIRTMTDVQIVFVDTPGLHRKADKAMNRMMNRTAASAIADADAVLFVLEADRFTAEDSDVLKRFRDCRCAVIAVLNKVDRVRPKERLLEYIAALDERGDFAAIVPVCAKSGAKLDALLAVLSPCLPESPPLFPQAAATDRSAEFRAAEIVREKLIVFLRDELPYGVTVEIERYEREGQGFAISAIVWVERHRQKGIVVGSRGSMLKRVGRAARLDLKRLLAVPVHLGLWVKVKDNWADSEADLRRLGYELP